MSITEFGPYLTHSEWTQVLQAVSHLKGDLVDNNLLNPETVNLKILQELETGLERYLY